MPSKKTMMAHSQVPQHSLKAKEKRVMERTLYPQPDVVPSATIRHEVANLAVTVRRFLELTRGTYQRYFVKRGLFEPIDELGFEQAWNTFFQSAVHLQARFESVLHLVEGLEPVPTLADPMASLKEQVRGYNSWFEKLRLTRRFTKIGELLVAILPREHPGAIAPAAFGQAEQTLTTMLTSMAKEQ
jgi:hypothetical protein